jgi:hypothetical protein
VERSDTHHVVTSPDEHADMTSYRRNFIARGRFFFTVNLAARRLRLLTQHIDDCVPHFARPAGIIRSRSTRP